MPEHYLTQAGMQYIGSTRWGLREGVVDMAIVVLPQIPPDPEAVPASALGTAPGIGSPVALVAAVVRAVEALLRQAPGDDAGGWAAREREAVIAGLDKVCTQATLYKGAVLAAHQDSGTWRAAGDRTFTGWRSRTGRKGAGDAGREIQTAEVLGGLLVVKEAAATGRIGLGHLEVLTRLKAAASAAVRAALNAGGEAELTELAERVDVGTFASRARAWAARIDVEALEVDREAAHRDRFLRFTTTPRGDRIEGFVPPLVGAVVREALDTLVGTAAVDDARTPEQRRVDALEAMAARTLEQGQDKVGAQVRPHLAVLVREETWTVLRRRQWFADGASGNGPVGGGLSCGVPVPELTGVVLATELTGVPVAELEDGTLVAPSELERLACDCELTRVVLTAHGVPLDVGREGRTYTKQLRRAVLTRDRHCQWPACRLRASWCEVHHMRYWRDGGRTSLGNAITLCNFHHHHVHQRRIWITIVTGGFMFTHADGRVIGGTTRLDDSLLCPNGRPGDRQGPDGQPLDGSQERGRDPDGRPPDGGRRSGRDPGERPAGRAGPRGLLPTGQVADGRLIQIAPPRKRTDAPPGLSLRGSEPSESPGGGGSPPEVREGAGATLLDGDGPSFELARRRAHRAEADSLF
ncbi:MAG: DUF222 domain-containing protein [Actinomycetales bacterium]|nr:DUF222 domain-containing protein [Actinomycetales bacterium]